MSLRTILIAALTFTVGLYQIASASAVFGKVVGVQDQTIYIELDDESVIKVGDKITITWDLDGTIIEAGKAEVVEFTKDLVVAKSLEGIPSLGMAAEIHTGVSDSQVANDTPEGTADDIPIEEILREKEPDSVAIISQQGVSAGEVSQTKTENRVATDVSSEKNITRAPDLDVGDWKSQSLFVRSKALTRFARGFSHEKAKTETGYRKALRLYRKTAKTGYARGQYRLAWMLENGIGVTADPALALAWYREAFSQGHEKAGLGVQRLTQNLDTGLE
ncbi:MAG: tetratricopeptide repeat protein [Pseudomonadota bacterium]